MIFLTHLALSVFVGLAFFPKEIIFCVLGGLLPDIDLATSIIGRKFRIFGWLFAHRGFFHTLYAALLFSLPLFFYSATAALAFFAGYLGHLLLDGLTKKGVRILPPFFRIKGPLKTSGLGDYAILVLLMCTIIVLLAENNIF